jgi:hypothetical protein
LWRGVIVTRSEKEICDNCPQKLRCVRPCPRVIAYRINKLEKERKEKRGHSLCIRCPDLDTCDRSSSANPCQRIKRHEAKQQSEEQRPLAQIGSDFLKEYEQILEKTSDKEKINEQVEKLYAKYNVSMSERISTLTETAIGDFDETGFLIPELDERGQRVNVAPARKSCARLIPGFVTLKEFERLHLSDDENHLLYYKRVLGKTDREIAIAFKKSEGAVKKALERAAKKDREGLLKRYGTKSQHRLRKKER